MRLFQVANGVDTVPQVDGLVRHHLDLLTLEQTFRLLGNHIGDAGFLGGKVVTELVHLVGLSSFGHLRKTHHFSGGKIFLAPGKNGVGQHVVFQIIGRELHILVGDRSAAVIVYHAPSVPEVRDNGILGRREGRAFQRTLVQHVQGIGPRILERIGPDEAIQLRWSIYRPYRFYWLSFQGIRQRSHLGAGREACTCQHQRQNGEILKNLPCHWFNFCYFCAKYNLQKYYIFQNYQNCIPI